MRCERCRVYEATMMIDDEWMCEVCTSGAVDPNEDYPGFGDEDDGSAEYEHDPECRCDDCREQRIEVQILFAMGELP
jgi:hypothetical protein